MHPEAKVRLLSIIIGYTQDLTFFGGFHSRFFNWADSTVLAYVMKTLNERYQYGLELFLLSIDEGITGYRDDSLEVGWDLIFFG